MAGKSRRLAVTITSALPWIAAARTWPVVGVGQVEFGSEVFVSRHEGIGKVSVHDSRGFCSARPGLYRGGQPEGCLSIPHGCRRSTSEQEVTVGETQQQVAKAGRIENIGVEQRRQASHCLLQAEFLVASGQFVERLAAAGFRLLAVREDIVNADATV